MLSCHFYKFAEKIADNQIIFTLFSVKVLFIDLFPYDMCKIVHSLFRFCT